MGTDIRGWVEVRHADVDVFMNEVFWFAVIDLVGLVSRNYSMFGSLFGVRNHADFQPIAAGRGLPPDPSPAVRAEAMNSSDFHSHTWVSWRELKAVDWDESALAGMAFGYRRGQEQHSLGIYLPLDDLRRREGESWVEDDMLFRVDKITRR